MSSSDPGRTEPVAGGPEQSHPSDLGTDPGRSQPYESLYRSASDVSRSSHRTTARHFETALTPPEEQSDPGDRFHWLYRSEPQSPQPESPEPESPGRADAAPGDHFRQDPAPVAVEVLAESGQVAESPAPADEPDLTRAPRGSRAPTVLVIAVVLLLIVVGIVAAATITGHRGPGAAQPPVAGQALSAGAPV